MNKIISLALEGWIPYQLFLVEEAPFCYWLDLGNTEIKEPFFSDTINKKRFADKNSRRLRSVSTLNMLPEWSREIESIPPTSIIFHVSRCGSTLISQLLEIDQQNIVLSEVPFFDELLRFQRNFDSDNSRSNQLFISALSFYATGRRLEHQRLFIKTDSWHIFFYDQFRKLFPTTPFVLLYRRPDEVIRSHQNRRGMQAVPGLIEPELFDFDKDEILSLPLDEYMARVLERYYESFIQIAEKDPLALLVNYNEGAINIVQKVARASGYTIPQIELTEMQERIKFHGKYPDQLFSEDTIHGGAPPYLERAFRLYEVLEKIRLTALHAGK